MNLGVRLRVLLLTFLVQAGFVWWVADSEIAQSVYLICYSLMMPTTLYLLCGGAIQRLFRLERREFLFSYVILTCTLPIIGFGGLRFLILAMGWLDYFAATQSQWTPYLPALPSLPVLHDPEAIRALYKGGPIPWQAWAVPIAFWSLFLLLLNGVWLGLAAVLHRIWIHHERLTFPITVLPIEMTGTQESPFRRPLFWMGAAIPVVLQSLLVLHDWYPSVPAMQLKAYDIKALLFPNPPWNALPNLGLSFYPMAIGLAYFMPGHISFSCVVFWVLIRLAYPIGSMLGFEAAGTRGARYPYPWEQGAGAWIAFAVLALAGVRHHWKQMLQNASPEDRRALRRLGGLAVVCMLLGTLLAASIGVSPLVAAGSMGVYIAYVLSGARVRAEAGGVWTFPPISWTPGRIMNELTFAPHGQPRPLVAGALTDMIYVDMRAQSLPFLMEGLKIGETVGIRWRTILFWAAIGSVTALALGWWFSLNQFYSLGAATAKSNTFAMVKVQVGMNEMHSFANRRPGFDHAGALAMLFGAGMTGTLAALRNRFLGFPLHPVGYILCNTYTMHSFFVPTLLAWLTKTLVLRYGGHLLYRRSLAFFVGLTIGDIGIQTAWTIIGRIFHVPIYQFLS